MFGWFKAKKNKDKDKCDWRSSNAHLLLLSKFRQPEGADRFQNDQNWAAALGESSRTAIRALRSAGMLRACELHELLEAKFKGSDLKRMLKAAGLKVSGRKAELALRLAENDEAGARQAVGDFFALRCTTEGEGVAEQFLAQQEKIRKNVESAVYNKLREQDFKGAAAIVKDFEADQVFSRGLGIDWSKTSMAKEIRELELISRNVPGILSGEEEETLRDLRTAAGMMLLWGTNTAKTWFPDGINTAGHLDADSAARMLMFYARHMDELSDLKELGVKSVQIRGVGDGNQCQACLALDGKQFTLKKVPELPLAKCTCEIGCRCGYQGVMQRSA